MTVSITTVKNILTRTSGYLRTVSSHSLQPYCGCTFGNSLCGVGCYVQHNGHLLRGRRWGSFLEVRSNAAESYQVNYERERRWARRRGIASGHAARQDDTQTSCWDRDQQIARAPGAGRFSIFCSSSTDPFLPQEFDHRITHSVFTAMLDFPPDELIVQTHSHRVTEYVDLLSQLSRKCDLRVHVSIETDLERLPGLPPHASPIDRRFQACRCLQASGVRTVVTVAPLLPIGQPEKFFARIAESADAVVIDHFIQGDGSANGSRTLRTQLPEAMRKICPESLSLDYRDRTVEIARRYLPGRVGVGIDGFAGRYDQ